ncbi:MAG: c-type cytochrome [Planctomycetia bacterium]|nr:c-type cytochrome [Planctomycetia bacterium]
MLRIRCLFASLTIFSSLVLPALAQKPPEEELKALVVPDDMEIKLFASEPMITNPSAIDIDTKGRVWVAEIQWYRRAAKTPGADQIKVLEDTDGDGKADKSTVFADTVFAPMSICVAGDKIFVATSPDLWMYEDKDGDLKADGPPKKVLTGFGGLNHDHGAHSLVLGPDHKWWMAHGDTGYNVTGVDGSKIEFPAGGMIRGELDGTKLENIATNFRNPYEIAVSSFGESFCSDNDNDGNVSVRICWILEGGNYGWYKRPGPKFSSGVPFANTWHFRGAIPGFVPSTVVTGFGSPCGMCYYEGSAIPSLKNTPLHCDAGPREVRAYPHQKSGAGFEATQRNIVTSKGDDYFRPDDICTAPDGTLYLADWYDGGVGGHAYNNPDQGRIFRLSPKGAKPARVEKPGPYTSLADAIVGLQSPNLATQYLAREKLLAEGQAAVPALVELMKSNTTNCARAMWVLDRIGGAARDQVVKLLECEDPALEALAVRILRRHGDDSAITARLYKKAAGYHKLDEIGRELLLFLAKQKGPQAEKAIAALAMKYAGGDRYALETIGIAARGREAAVYDALVSAGSTNWETLSLLDPKRGLPAVIALLNDASAASDARLQALNRLAVALDDSAFAAVVALAGNNDAEPSLRKTAVHILQANCHPQTGLWAGIIGPADGAVTAWTKHETADPKKAREQLVECAKRILRKSDDQGGVLNLVVSANLPEVGAEVLPLIDSSNPQLANHAIYAASALRPKGAGEALLKTLSNNKEPKLREAALNALVDMQQWNALKSLVATGAPKSQVENVVNRMMSTTGGALAYLKWIDAEGLDTEGRKLAVAKAINHPDANIRVLYERFVPEGQRPQRLGATMKAEDILKLTGNPSRGEQVYNQSSAAQCKNCHTIRGIGKNLGPNLTQIGKKYEKAALLETIMDPSKAISHEYVTYVVETADGQSYTGFVADKEAKTITVRTAEDKQIKIDAKNIESLTASPKSMMPELVLREVTAQDAADLLAYLMTLK